MLALPLHFFRSRAEPPLPARLLDRLAAGFRHGTLSLATPAGSTRTFVGREHGPHAALTIHSWRMLWRVLTRWDLGFAESFMAGEWSTPDLSALLVLLDGNRQMGLAVPRFDSLTGRLRHLGNRNSRRGSRRNIAAHYDLGNAFYEQWLDPGMTYSSALYPTQGHSLEEAQEEKIARLCALLELEGNEHVLEIGCGWGSLALALAERHACRVTAVTLSREQLSYARARLHASAVPERCDFRLEDYRDVTGTFDRIVSVEMIEAVGRAYWPGYSAVLRDRLKPGGIAAVQAITIDESRFAAYCARPDFIQRYIFPGGMLPTKTIIGERLDAAGLRLEHAEFFGKSYARTLADWRARFLAAWPQIAELGFDTRFRRMWEYYLAYCEAGFATGVLDVGMYRISHRR